MTFLTHLHDLWLYSPCLLPPAYLAFAVAKSNNKPQQPPRRPGRDVGRRFTTDAAPRPSPELRDKYDKKLTESGITEARAKKLGLRLMDAVTANTRLKLGLEPDDQRGGFLIPYYDLKGKQTKHWRFRYLEKGKGFYSLTKAGDNKYTQPGIPGIHIYWSPEIENWEERLADPAIDFYITEGELKAICACGPDFDLSTLCVGGKDLIHSAKGKADLHPDLRRLKPEGLIRNVYIVYDSDAQHKPDVRAAEIRLADRLTELGCVPYIVRLPPKPNGNTMKLDDFLVTHGKDAFLKLVADTPPYDRAQKLHELAAELVYIESLDLVYRPSDRLRMKTDKFQSSHYKNWHDIIEVEDKDGNKKKVKIEWAKEFMAWKARPQLAGFTFVPGGESVVDGCYNLWPGFPVEPKKGDVTLWHQLLDHIFYKKPKEARIYFERWVAYPLQHLGAKLKQAVIIWGDEGVGKGVTGRLIARLYGLKGGNRKSPLSTAIVFNNDLIHNKFNGWAESRQFALGDEIKISNDQRAVITEKLKELITEPTIEIERKGWDTYTMPNCMNIMLISNRSDVVKLNNNDRRYFVVRVESGELPKELRDPLLLWADSEEGLAALLYYLLHLPLGDFDPNASAMKTADREDMVTATASAHETWLRAVYDKPDEHLDKLRYELWTTEELVAIFKAKPGNERSPVNANTIGNALAVNLGKKRAYNGPIRTSKGQKNLWIIPRSEANEKRYRAMTKAELGQAYDREREAEDRITKQIYSEEKNK